MSKFKVGERVKLKGEVFVEGCRQYGYSGEGSVEQVSLEDDAAAIRWDIDEDYWWYTDNDLQSVKNTPEIQGLDEAYEQHKEYSEGTWKPKKIKSDGGSSSYYDLPISDKLLIKVLNSRNEDGECYVKTEDLIDELFENDFDFGTMFKSVVRGYLQTKGEGKAGNDLDYEMNKVVYYANKIKEKGCEY